MERRDPYEVLGVDRKAASEEIKAAYRRLAREHHPDVNPDDADAEERFKELSYAKDILTDDEKRKLYDEFGFDGLSPGFEPEQARAYHDWARRAERSSFRGGFEPEVGLEDLFGDLFGAGSQRWATRGADLETQLTVDFLDAVRGAEVRVQLEGRNPLRVRVPVGTQDGTRIRLAGQGADAIGGGQAGDLYIRLRVRPHPFFRRKGDDLELELPVTLVELIRGGEIEVPTPSGPVQLKVPAGSANGQRLRLRGKGVARAGGTAGDLYVKLVAVLPSEMDARLHEIAQQLEPLYENEDVRRHLRLEPRR
jgi:curved DNA-binding protein